MARNISTALLGGLLGMGACMVHADQVILDDLIVTGSNCVGMDCVNGENFGFDTIRLKENNLRIKFQDTSNSGSFPSNDWQITANDSTNGGANKFSIDDIDGGRTPFTIEASAPSDSLYVDDGGRIGIGTGTPVVEVHVVDGDSPTLRLEQDGSSGFTPQTWDVAGNETNFFVRDATNGSPLPFRIRPSAPQNSLYIDTDGDIGLGTASPDAGLHAIGTLLVGDSDTGSPAEQSPIHFLVDEGWPTQTFTIENTNSAATNSASLQLKNEGYSFITFTDTSTNAVTEKWNLGNRSDGSFTFSNAEVAGLQFKLDQAGNLTILGDLTANGTNYASSKKLKENFSPVNNESILETLSSIPITSWNYKAADDEERHIGPMAEDFHAAFSLNGSDNGKISVSDVNGIALAAIQALKAQLDQKDEDIKQLNQRLEHLEKNKE